MKLKKKKELFNRKQLRAHWKKNYNSLTWKQFKIIWEEGKRK